MKNITKEEIREKLVSLIGKTISGVIDRPLGSRHPNYPSMIYKVNYGYIMSIKALDNEYQDAYYLGSDVPLKEFKGIVIAVITRDSDNEDKIVVAPPGINYTNEEIEELINFQEQYFVHKIIRWGIIKWMRKAITK